MVRAARPLQVTPDPDLATVNPRPFPKFWKNTKVITSREFISIVAPHFVL